MFLCFWLFALPRLLISRFSFVKQPPSVEITRGVFLSPETFPRKIFPKIFSNLPKRLFADFLARICDEGKGVLCPALWGGYPFLWACGLASALSLSAPFPCLFFPCSLVAPAVQALSFVPCCLVGGWCWSVVLGFPRSLVPRSLSLSLVPCGLPAFHLWTIGQLRHIGSG